MATKTINLTGAEVAVTGLDGANAKMSNTTYINIITLDEN